MEILLKFEEMCQDITKEFSSLFSKARTIFGSHTSSVAFVYLYGPYTFVFFITLLGGLQYLGVDDAVFDNLLWNADLALPL